MKKKFIRAMGLLFTIALVIGIIVFAAVNICKVCFPKLVTQDLSEIIVEKAKALDLPYWVNSQIIDVHTTARTGMELKSIKNIVIHYVGNAGTSAQNNRDYFNKPQTTVSSHFVVGLEGEVIQCLPLWERSAASNHRNKDTISIEVCHPDESGEFSTATYNRLVELVAFLCENLGLDETQVIRHYDITEKICPKFYVENPEEWQMFLGFIKERLDKNEN